MKAYIDLANRILEEGVDVYNERTSKFARTVIGHTFTFDARDNLAPILTTRKAPWRTAVAEFVGYLRGYDNAAQFRAIGAKTWDANTNENAAWLANPHRKGEGDLGLAYGVVSRGAFTDSEGKPIDLVRKVYDHLRNGIDDRGEIITYYHPGVFDRACLRPCMHTHQFSLLGGGLYLNSFQRSADMAIGLGVNCCQVFFFLKVMAQITGHTPMFAQLTMVNIHLYQDHISLMREQVKRNPFPSPSMHITPELRTLEDLETWFDPRNPEHIWLEGYQHHEPIKYPFAV